MDTKLSLGRPIDDRQSSLAMDQGWLSITAKLGDKSLKNQQKNDRQSDLFVIFFIEGYSLYKEGNIMKKRTRIIRYAADDGRLSWLQ